MKNLILALLILIVLVAAFSTIETHTERFVPEDGWSFYGGSSGLILVEGEASPGEGGQSDDSVSGPPVSIEKSGLTEIPDSYSPITVEVIQEEETESSEEPQFPYELLCSVGYALIAINLAIGIVAIVLGIRAYAPDWRWKHQQR